MKLWSWGALLRLQDFIAKKSIAYATCCRKIKTYSIKNHAWYRRINTQLQYIFIDSSSSHKHVHKIVCMYHVYATAWILWLWNRRTERQWFQLARTFTSPAAVFVPRYVYTMKDVSLPLLTGTAGSFLSASFGYFRYALLRNISR